MRLVDVAQKQGLTKTEVARQAIRWYLDHCEDLASIERDREIARSIRAMTDRICGMLARQGAQIGTLYELTWESHQDAKLEGRFTAAVSAVKQRMRRRLTDDEHSLSEKMKRIVSS